MVIEWWRILRAFYCLTFFSEAKIKTQNQHKRIEMENPYYDKYYICYFINILTFL